MEVERVAWDQFLQSWTWRQGEHVTLLGPTGSGKTTLTNAILPLRGHVVVFGTKRADDTLDVLRDEHGYKVIRDWPPKSIDHRVILWPKIDTTDKIPNQRAVFVRALRDIYATGGWTTVFDEVRYMTDPRFLNMPRLIELLWQQGRSSHITVVAGTQRPAWIPLAAYDQASWLFLWRDNDRRNLRRLGELGLDAMKLGEVVGALPEHDVAVVNTRTGAVIVTNVSSGGVPAAVDPKVGPDLQRRKAPARGTPTG